MHRGDILTRYIATNISLLTTTQSVIAEELDAFEKTSWFTSAYLVNAAQDANWSIAHGTDRTSDRHVKHISTHRSTQPAIFP